MGVPRVSVLMTTYNRPHLLPRALDSLTAQTFRDFDVVIVNDAGRDPGRILDRFRDRLDITLVTHPTNLGVTHALNSAIGAATGEYVTLLADDDRYLPNHLDVLTAQVIDNPSLIPYTDGMQVIEDEAGNVSSRRVLPVPATFDRDRLLVENFIPAIAQLIPRAAFDLVGGPFDTALEVLEDWELWLRLSARYEFRRIDAVTFEYFMRGGRSNITTRERWRFHQCLVRVYDRHPVPAGSALESLRQRVLVASRRRADAYLFDLTVAIAAPPVPDEILGALRSVVSELAGQSYELIVVTKRTAEVEEFAGLITGNVSFVLTEGDPRAELEAVARRRAAGRRVHIVGDISDLRLDELRPPVGARS